jgi:hypothetical protein
VSCGAWHAGMYLVKLVVKLVVKPGVKLVKLGWRVSCGAWHAGMYLIRV